MRRFVQKNSSKKDPMKPELLGRAEAYRGFMHQNEVQELEELAEDSLEFFDGPFHSRITVMYDETSQSPLNCSNRSFLYILGDFRDLLDKPGLDSVIIRQVPIVGLPWRKAPVNTGATLLMPIGAFEEGTIEVCDHLIPVEAGDCVVVPHDEKYRVRFGRGRMFLISAHGRRQGVQRHVVLEKVG